MPYTHSGEVGDIWKHLPLCEILKIERPVMYRESNSAYAGYTITSNPKTEYGILKMLGLNNNEIVNSEYYRVLKRNGIDGFRYTGSPGLAMEILSNKAKYVFHDLEKEALDDVESFAVSKGLKEQVQIICGDSISAFMDKDYLIDGHDFVFIDPYTPFDVSKITSFNFFDIFKKSITSKAKTMMWYGYDSLNGQHLNLEQFRKIASELGVAVWTFDLWLQKMDTHGCEINPGVPGCGLACVNLSSESIDTTEKYLKLVEDCYANSSYYGSDAVLLTKINRFSYL